MVGKHPCIASHRTLGLCGQQVSSPYYRCFHHRFPTYDTISASPTGVRLYNECLYFRYPLTTLLEHPCYVAYLLHLSAYTPGTGLHSTTIQLCNYLSSHTFHIPILFQNPLLTVPFFVCSFAGLMFPCLPDILPSSRRACIFPSLLSGSRMT